jgi:hypothetical protein
MKRLLIALVAVAFAASPAAAAKKHAKAKQPTEAEQIAQQREYTKRVLVDSLPIVLPTWSLPIFFAIHKDGLRGDGKDKKL